MIGDLKPYPVYKASGLPWLGQVPAHWEIKRNGSLFQQRNDVGKPDWPILEVSLRTGVRIRQFGSTKRKQVMSDKAKYKCAIKGDFVYNMMRMWQGAAGIAPVDGLVSPAYVVAKPFPHVNPAYFASLFRTEDYLAEIDAFSRGIVKDRNRLYWDQFKQIPTPFPSPAEQAAIVRFLDWANGRLERAIRAKRKVIALLNEQKQAIIHRAVTRGLDPSVPLKPSGIPWLGEIPAHWEVRKIKQCASRFFAGGTPDSGNERYYTDSESGTPWLVIGDISGQRRVQSSANRITEAGRDSRNLELLPEGTVVLAMYASVGAAAILDSPSAVNQALIGIAPREHLTSSDWLLACLESVRPELLKQASASTQANLNAWKVRNIIIPLPLVSEQRAIVVEIDRNLSGLQSVISRLEREIGLLREYRIRLVADVVTGKLDVREAASRLPNEELLPDLVATDDEPDDLPIEEEADA